MPSCTVFLVVILVDSKGECTLFGPLYAAAIYHRWEHKVRLRGRLTPVLSTRGVMQLCGTGQQQYRSNHNTPPLRVPHLHISCSCPTQTLSRSNARPRIDRVCGVQGGSNRAHCTTSDFQWCVPSCRFMGLPLLLQISTERARGGY